MTDGYVFVAHPNWGAEEEVRAMTGANKVIFESSMAPFHPTGPTATTDGVKRVLIRLAATEGMPLFWRDYFRNQHD